MKAQLNRFRVVPRINLPRLLAVVLASAIGVAGLFADSYFLSVSHRAAVLPVVDEPAPDVWSIEGALTEACTCAVPCTCNFGEGPSPHDYCFAIYSYDIRKGHYKDVTLDGLRFGATDLKSGRTIFIDERASDIQRQALRVIIARVIERASQAKAVATANDFAKDVRYVAIKQEYNTRQNHLEVNGIGEFSASYIMGLDKTQPLVVRNNTTWRIHDAIKAKTSILRVRIRKDSINTKNTNSNQGDFEYTDRMDFGSPVEWSCGAFANVQTRKGKDKSNGNGKAKGNSEAMCGL